VTQNFDELLTPADHVTRSRHDTYYVDDERVLRCHMTAHQGELLRAGHRRFLMAGDVYRCDTVDATHFPVFHQLDGVRLFPADKYDTDAIVADMKGSLENVFRGLFGDVKMRWVDAYFPFTDPSFELEVWYRDEWLEVLGCGVMRQPIVDIGGVQGQRGWAFGLGLERIAMALFQVPDIRLFWSNDARFRDQFSRDRSLADMRFQPYSRYPPIWHDISFWIADGFHENQFHELVRECGGELVEDVRSSDEFTHPKTGRTSHTYRLTFRHMDRSLTNSEIDVVMDEIRKLVQEKLGVELR